MTAPRSETTVYVISAAAELAGMHPQTLRQYDRLGLVTPMRTSGKGRRYTPADIRRLREIQRLSQEEGVNLAGINRIMELTDQVEALQAEVQALRRAVEQASPRVRRVFTADSEGRINARSPRSPEYARRGESGAGHTGGEMVVRGRHWLDNLSPEMSQLLTAMLLVRSQQGPQKS